MTSARAYAERLLTALGHQVLLPLVDADGTALWAASGAMALTGRAAGPPLAVAGPAVAAQGVLTALRALAPEAALPDVRLLGERAAMRSLHRNGDHSCGGGSRLLRTADGHAALSLARPSDLDLVPALVEDDSVEDAWDAVSRWAVERSATEVRDRAVLLGLATGLPGERPAAPVPWRVLGQAQARPRAQTPLVVDLSALWAGPLAASLLRALGCEVVKVEDVGRRDGARRGDPGLFALLHHGVTDRVLDLRTDTGLAELRALLERAQVVIEGSRPRALQQLGIVAEASPGRTWLSITGHGRDQPERIGYGDDTAVAGGLLAWDEHGPVFVGDAVADPLTGLHAALVAWAGVLTGSGALVDLPLAAVAATAASLGPSHAVAARRTANGWCVSTPQGEVPVAQPWARPLP